MFQSWSRLQLAIGGDLAALLELAATLLLILGLHALHRAASVTDRLQEKIAREAVSLPTVECASKLPGYLMTGRLLLAAAGLLLGGVVTIFSVTWDGLLFPKWRKFYRKRYPLGRLRS